MTALSVTSHVLLMTNIPADWGGILVEVEYQTHRIICLEHGVYVAEVPWAYPGNRFTKDFDLTVAWFAYPICCARFTLNIVKGQP